MSIKDIVPRGRGDKTLPAVREDGDSFERFHREMNRLFDGFGSTAVFPKVNIEEDPQTVRVSVELPGMDEKDVDVSVTGDTLILRGEKTEEKEDKGKNYHRRERSYGSFRRVIGLPSEVEKDRATAVFKKGVLTLSLPKTASARSGARRIAVKRG